MKKTFLFATIFLILVSTTSCKKLLGLDPESLLSKKPWKGDKFETYIDGSLNNSTNIDDAVLEFNKKTHRYVLYRNNSASDEGTWTYDEDTKRMILDSDTEMPVSLYVTELKKKNLNFELTQYSGGNEIVIKFYFYRN